LKSTPRIRTVEKAKSLYPLNRFPKGFPIALGREIVYRLATIETPTIEGPEWEKIFAGSIGADWIPSNVGLDDVQMGNTAWGVKSVKNGNPFRARKVRIISGRNNPEYSFDEIADTDAGIGEQVLKIWNSRVEGVRSKFANLRTIVFIKSDDLTMFAVFEMNTELYRPGRFRWERNKQGNLEGIDVDSGEHRFTWQRHGSQFTILEEVPEDRLLFMVRKPEKIPLAETLRRVGFDPCWVTVVDPED